MASETSSFGQDAICKTQSARTFWPSGGKSFVGSFVKILMVTLDSDVTALADTVPNTFPQRRILHYYTDPITSWSQNRRGVARIPHVSLCLADLGKIASFCSHRFSWGSSTVQDKMSSLIWEGHIVRSLCIVSGARYTSIHDTV